MLIILGTLLLARAFAQDAGCDFSQNVQPSLRYTIASPNYAGSYPRSVTCRWLASSPSGYQCRLDCYLELPLSSGCAVDRVLISRNGDPQFNNAESYCGRQTLTGILSVNQNIGFALITASNSPGGRFFCNLTAQAVPPPPTPCVCGIQKQNRIVGGTQTGVNEYTMMAGVIERSVRLILCGAVIITDSYIMLAAHCLEGQNTTSIEISIGNRDLYQGARYNAVVIKIHPNYNPNTYVADLALIGVSPRIVFSNNVTPVCLPFQYQNVNLAGARVTLLGWGTTSFGGPTSNILLQTSVTIISQQQCQRYKPTVSSQEICTQTPGNDSCQFDSGGPNLLTDPRTRRLFSVGIVSNGVGCGSDNPSFSTRVTEYLNWIVNNAPYDYCVQ